MYSTWRVARFSHWSKLRGIYNARNLVLRHDAADLVHVTVAEDEPDVAVDRREQLVQAELLIHLHVQPQPFALLKAGPKKSQKLD